jgi:uncharacterized protein (DUF1684 family)
VQHAYTAILVIAAAVHVLAADYLGEVQQWRKEREQRLAAPYGWLSLSGLFWLNEGNNRLGSSSGNEVRLPRGFGDNLGAFVRTGERVEFRPGPSSGQVHINGKHATASELRTDKAGQPDEIAIGRLRLQLIDRGGRIGVRLRDPESEFRKNFRGLNWYPVQARYAIKANFKPYSKPRVMTFEAQAGGPQQMTSPGYVEFQLNKRDLRLTPVQEGDELFFIFRDKTSGKTTYPAARFLYSKMPENGTVLLDFNKAYNPPCVFTPYSTCPLPPPENRLPVEVEAGEKLPPSYDSR